MAKKGKGGKNKMANMSEEDRLRYMQHLAEIEQEFKRRRQQLISTFMKNKLKREDAFTRLNLAKINEEWRSLLRQIKCKELKDEVTALQNVCFESLDHKNCIIKRLLCDLDESEELYSALLNSHIENIGLLMAIHSERLEVLQEWFAKEKISILERCSQEIRTYKVKKFQAQKQIECIYFGMASEANQRERALEEEHMQKREDLKNMMLLKLDDITKVRESKMDHLWKEFQKVLSTYLKNTEEYRNEYIDLRKHDSNESQTIQDHYADVAQATEVIAELKVQMNLLQDEHKFNVSQLNKYRMDMNERIDQIKVEIEIGNSDDQLRLRRMVIFSMGAMRKLSKLCKKGERIQQITGFCQRQETDHERSSYQHNNEDNQGHIVLAKRQFLQYSDDEICSVPAEFEGFKRQALNITQRLEKFWVRYNNSKIDCSCLREEKLMLHADNHRLKMKMKNYLMNVNMAAGGVDNTGNGLISRPQSMIVERVIHMESMKSRNKKKRPVTCIEANMSVAVRSVKLMAIRNFEKSIHSIVR